MGQILAGREAACTLSSTLAGELYINEKPFNLNFPVNHVPGARQSNVIYEYVEGISVTDMRGREDDFHLNICGFLVFKSPLNYPMDTFDDLALTCTTYCRDMEIYMKRLLQADKVYIYDSQVYKIQCPSYPIAILTASRCAKKRSLSAVDKMSLK